MLCVLGEEALELETLAARRQRSTDQSPLGLGDFFFDPNDVLHPDRFSSPDDADGADDEDDDDDDDDDDKTIR